MKLVNRVSVFFLAGLAVVLVVSSGHFYAFVRAHLVRQFEQELLGTLNSLVAAAEWLLADPEAARRLGAAGREVALARYGVDRFLADWDRLLEEEVCGLR